MPGLPGYVSTFKNQTLASCQRKLLFFEFFKINLMSSIAKMLRNLPHSFNSDYHQTRFAGLALAGPGEAISPRGTLSQAELRRIVADMVG
jgi:hypothetical protein